jgi:hypothetical protein
VSFQQGVWTFTLTSLCCYLHWHTNVASSRNRLPRSSRRRSARASAYRRPQRCKLGTSFCTIIMTHQTAHASRVGEATPTALHRQQPARPTYTVMLPTTYALSIQDAKRQEAAQEVGHHVKPFEYNHSLRSHVSSCHNIDDGMDDDMNEETDECISVAISLSNCHHRRNCLHVRMQPHTLTRSYLAFILRSIMGIISRTTQFTAKTPPDLCMQRHRDSP